VIIPVCIANSPDWIHDSLRERNRKVPQTRPGTISDRLNHLDGVLGWLWRSLSKALQEGEAYVVITLVGAYIIMVQS
jgi:chloride channel 3/4/5